MRGRYELFPHGADIGIRGFGATKADAFAQAALALTAAVTAPEDVASLSVIPIRCEAASDVTLFVDWINALIFEMAVRKMLFRRFDVTITGHALTAAVWGEAVDRVRHEPAAEPKGATYTMARVAADDGGWVAQCVVDV